MTTYYQYILAKPQYLDGDGDPYSGGKLYFYEAGTSTPLAVYKTASGTAHSSPIVLDSEGRIPDSDGIFLGTGDSYKVVLNDVNDVEVFSIDNLVTYGGDGTITFAMIQDLSANVLLGSIAGGTVEEISLTAAGRALLDDASAAAQLVTLGLTASAAEINYNDGLSGNVQDQLDVLTAAVAAKPTYLSGRISVDGSGNPSINKSSGGFSVSKVAINQWRVTFDAEITDTYNVVTELTGLGNNPYGSTVATISETSTSFVAASGDDETGVNTIRDWNFILVYTAS